MRTSSRALAVGAGLTLLSGCEERDRLTFPPEPDGIGPVTMIERPNQADTTVPAGPGVIVSGRTADHDGVDTVYFLVVGGEVSFPPVTGGAGVDTVRFGIPITTSGQSGRTFTVRVYGVDVLGNVGDTSSRRIAVQ